MRFFIRFAVLVAVVTALVTGAGGCQSTGGSGSDGHAGHSH